MIRQTRSLDGDWQWTPDPQNEGFHAKWYDKPQGAGETQTIAVPGSWDQVAPGYSGVAWYFLDMDLDETWLGKTVYLRFEAVDYYCELWVNAQRIGEHEGGYTPFGFDVSEALRPGGNRFALRVLAPRGLERIDGFAADEIPAGHTARYGGHLGIIGSVTLEKRPAAHIDDIFVCPDLRRKRLVAHVTTSEQGEVRLTIEGTGHTESGEPGALSIPFGDAELWSPQSPERHVLQCALLQEGQVVDTLSVAFGMREFSVRDGHFFLNNRPFYLKAVARPAFFPQLEAGADPKGEAERELRLVRQAGFNMVRFTGAPPPEAYLEAADELGVLVWEEPPIGWIRKSPHLRERCERAVRELVCRDRNHPSCVMWGILSESGNVGRKSKAGAQPLKDELGALIRELDPTRLIVDDAGGEVFTREPTRYMRPYSKDFTDCDDVAITERAPLPPDAERYLRALGAPDRLAFVSSLGFTGLADPGTDDDAFAQVIEKGFAARSLERAFTDSATFAAACRELQADAVHDQLDAVRGNPKLAGYCLTQLLDTGADAGAGLVDAGGQPKAAFDEARRVQRSVRTLIRLSKTNLVPREEVDVEVTMVNDGRFEGHADLSLQVVGPTNQVLWKKKRGLKVPPGGKEVWKGRISASGAAGHHSFVVRLMQKTKVLAENRATLHVYGQPDKCDTPIYVLDPNAEWQARCLDWAEQGDIFAPIYIIPPLANTIRAYPDNELNQILAQVRGGAIALWFSPPEDWNDLARWTEDQAVFEMERDVRPFYYAKLHPVFEGLPARTLMTAPYRNILPYRSFAQTGEEDICGCLDLDSAQRKARGEQVEAWRTGILSRRYGGGRIVFVNLHILENLGNDPVATRLFINLLRHFQRRSVPSDTLLPLHQRSVEWMRTERTRRIRRWMVLGMFPNWNGEGHDKDYAPEHKVELDTHYQGWHGPIAWRRYYSDVENRHTVDFTDALWPGASARHEFDHGTGYAYAEFVSDRRFAAEVRIGTLNATKLWINGNLIHETKDQWPEGEGEHATLSAPLRQGRNTVLVKVSKNPGPARFSLDVCDPQSESSSINWWR